MYIYKFGGASVKDAAAVKNVIEILQQHLQKNTLIVISAMGKTTNALEEVVNNYIAKNENWLSKLDEIEQFHKKIVANLYFKNEENVLQQISAQVENCKAFLEKNNNPSYNFIYDQVVSLGEFLSTIIVAAYAKDCGLNALWLDAKTCIYTDNAYTEGKINWDKTNAAIQQIVPPLLQNNFVITQGFVGMSDEGFTTTLGREGSDYTAAVFSFCLDATQMTVWKDVAGIMNADPKAFSDAQFISELTYTEAIEMTYYGASVIHPKTIKPLQNKNIPMEVRSFVDYQKKGTFISSQANTNFLPPIIISKKNQMLLSFSTKDFSFIAEDHLIELFDSFAKNRLRINMMQNAAISFSVCIDNKKEKIDAVIESLSPHFSIVRNEQLELLTIRHYYEGIVSKLTENKDVLLRQISRNTIQVLMRG